MKNNRWPSLQKLRDTTGYFSKIIRVDVPTFYYWDEDGEFAGMMIGGMPACEEDRTPYTRQLAREVMRAVNGEESMPKRETRHGTPLPEVFKKAIREFQGRE